MGLKAYVTKAISFKWCLAAQLLLSMNAFVVRVFANIRLVNTMDIDKRMETAVPFVLGW